MLAVSRVSARNCAATNASPGSETVLQIIEILWGLPEIFSRIEENILSSGIAPGECNYIFSRPLKKGIYSHTYAPQLARFLYLRSVCREVGIDLPFEYILAVRARAKQGK